MFGQLLTQTVPANGYITTMNVTMTRMLAQVDLTYTIDASITSSFTLEQVRSMQRAYLVCNIIPRERVIFRPLHPLRHRYQPTAGNRHRSRSHHGHLLPSR